MTNEAIAAKISDRVNLIADQAANLAAKFAEVERLRLIGVGIAQQITELEEIGMANGEQMFAITSEIEETLSFLRQPVDAPAETVARVAKLAREKAAAKEVPVEIKQVASDPVDKTAQRLAILEDPTAPPCAKCHAVSECSDCCKECLSKCDTAQVCRVQLAAKPERERPVGIEEIEAKMQAETIRRDSMCDKWRDCEHSGDCFDPKKKALAGAYCLPQIEACWNSSCAWSDLATADHCDADARFRQDRPIAECKCFVGGDRPQQGQDAAACFNTNCVSNDPEVPNCCDTWAEVWECPELVTAGWGPAEEDGALSLDEELAKARAKRIETLKEKEQAAPKKGRKPRTKKSATPAASTEAGKQEEVRPELYRPSNGAEGECFQAAFCEKCNKDDTDNDHYCDILTNTQAYGIEDPEYPREWIYSAGGQPTCTAFSPKHQGEVSAAATPTCYSPLDESINDCDLCMGYGVIEGEVDGESALIPCSCEAGDKVKGGVAKSACDDCNLEDPDCANCHLPDMDGASPVEADEPASDPQPIVKCGFRGCISNDTSKPDHCAIPLEDRSGKPVTGCSDYRPEKTEPEHAELPRCANGNCTANDPLKGEYCLRIDTLEREGRLCDSFVPVEDCKHDPAKRYNAEDGSLVCGLCDQVLQQSRRAASEPTALQQKCTHPAIFRKQTPDGELCNCCKLILSGGGRRDCLPFDLEPPPAD